MKLLLAPEVAALLRCSTNRVYELAARGTLPCVRLGRQLRFPEEKVLAWIDRGGTPLEASPEASPNVVPMPMRGVGR
jgi:excisionase family DNA binding protein